MIKLNRSFTPTSLTPDFAKTKTEEYKSTGSSVWNISWLKESLLELSHGKCAYCECDLMEESKYMEVEHFEDKDHYPEKVIEWSNLLPSCKRCNGAKSNHDVNLDPIINPFVDNPSAHLFFHLYRFNGRDIKGKNTIEVLNLNHIERAVTKRFEVGDGLISLIDIADERLENYKSISNTKSRNRLITLVEQILNDCQPSEIYAATCATVLHNNYKYDNIRSNMKVLGVWNDELEILDRLSSSLAYDSHI